MMNFKANADYLMESSQIENSTLTTHQTKATSLDSVRETFVEPQPVRSVRETYVEPQSVRETYVVPQSPIIKQQSYVTPQSPRIQQVQNVAMPAPQIQPASTPQAENPMMTAEYTKYCQKRFAELMQIDPTLCTDRVKVCALLAEEWKLLKSKTSLGIETTKNEFVLKNEVQVPAVVNPSSSVDDSTNLIEQQHPAHTYHLMIDRPRHKWSVTDGRAPKKALTGYMIYVKERKLVIMQENPHLTFGQVMQLVAEKWRGLSDDDKQYYHKKAEQDKVRHQQEQETWNTHLQSNPEANQWKRFRRPGQVIFTQPQPAQFSQFQNMKPGAQNQPAQKGNSQVPDVSQLNPEQSQSPAYLLQMVQQQQQYIQSLLESKNQLEEQIFQVRSQITPSGQQTYLELGQEIFLKSVSQEIMRRSPKMSDNAAEVVQTVEKEWQNLSADQKLIFEKIAQQTLYAASKVQQVS